MRTEQNLPFCPGSERDYDSTRKWYIPPGCISADVTICERCYIQIFKADSTFKVKSFSPGTGVNCDAKPLLSVEENWAFINKLKYLKMRDVGIRICDRKNNPLNLIPNNEANERGVGHFELPSNTDYQIKIVKLCNDDNLYLQLEEGFCGKEKISYKSNLYDPYSIELQGIDEKRSFKFLSPTSLDRLMEGKNPNEKLEGENESNIITLKVNLCKRIPAVVYRSQSNWQLYSGIRSMGIDEDGCRSRGGGHQESYHQEKSAPTKGFSGGMTVSGGLSVHQAQGQSTKDTFEVIDRMTFKIQLVCNQTEEEKNKANKEFHLRKMKELGDQIDQKQKYISSLKNQIQVLEKSIESTSLQLETAVGKRNLMVTTLASVGLYPEPRQEDYLISFD